MGNVIFRADSSRQIGSGHLMRCLTLADALKEQAAIFFVCRDLPGNLSGIAAKAGFTVLMLNNKDDAPLSGYEKLLGVSAAFDAQETADLLAQMPRADCLIVDHYALDGTWEKAMRPYVKKIMVIDDLADRPHDCDMLLDQNCDIKARYEKLVTAGCKLFLGTKYLLLREEFYQARENLRRRDGSINNILVFFGGGDAGGETMKALRAISSLGKKNIQVNVVVGASNFDKDNIRAFCQKEGMAFHCQIDYMPKLMQQADIAIGAGGTTGWERRFLGLPALVVSIADNQTGGCIEADKAGWLDYLGEAKDVTEITIKATLERYLAAPEKLKAMGDKCLRASNFGREGQKELVNSILS